MNKVYRLFPDKKTILKAMRISPLKHLVLFIVYATIFIALFCIIFYTHPLPGHRFTRSQLLLADIFVLTVELHLIVVFIFYPVNFLKELTTTKKKEFFLLLISLAIIISAAEFGLRRVFKITPGIYLSSPWFHRVDTLVCLKGFYADSDGIFKADPETPKEIHEQIVSHSPENLPDGPDPKSQNPAFYILSREFLSMFTPGFDNEFVQMVKRTEQKPINERNDLDSAILHYIQYPVNSDGFRSIEMKPLNTRRKKILLLGDSFAWGFSTSNITNSFADILLSKGYIVYNTGICGADPAQYLAVARKYIPLLKPDIVMVNFFMGNDIIYFRRPVLPFKPIFYSTNAGNLYACPNGMYLNSPQEAYKLIVKNYDIPVEKGWVNRICSKTAIGTLVWIVLGKFEKVNAIPLEYEDYWKKADSLLFKKPYSNIEVDSIRMITENNGAKFMLFVIPDMLDKELSDPQKVPYLFEGLNYYISPVKSSGYNLINGHFNDAGHKQYAEFLDSLARDFHR